MPSLAPAAVRLAESSGSGPTLDIPIQVWALTLGVIVALFTFDLVISGRNPHAVGFKEAVGWSVFYISVAIVFGLVFAWWAGSPYGAEYFAGYIVEKTLSIDNLFVFVIIMSAFAVPAEHRHKLLTLGIALALVLRAIFIAIGATLLAYFSFMFLVFGAILIVTGIKLYQHRDQDPDVQDNALVRATKRRIPVTEDYREGHFFVRENGVRMATPLFIAFVAIASTDILFALDSIPAVYGVTNEPYIVFVANAFALLGLRALFFLVDGLLDRLIYLSTGLAHDPGVHRHQALAALGARDLAVGAGDLDRVLPGVHRCRADRDHGREHRGGAPGSVQAGARGLVHRQRRGSRGHGPRRQLRALSPGLRGGAAAHRTRSAGSAGVVGHGWARVPCRCRAAAPGECRRGRGTSRFPQVKPWLRGRRGAWLPEMRARRRRFGGGDRDGGPASLPGAGPDRSWLGRPRLPK